MNQIATKNEALMVPHLPTVAPTVKSSLKKNHNFVKSLWKKVIAHMAINVNLLMVHIN